MNGLLQIGEVAARTALTPDAIRFYERERLLRASTRTSGGFRLFSASVVEELTFIGNAQELGFSLQEIRELLDLKRASNLDCGHIEQLLENKIAIVHGKIAALRKLERELQRAVSECQSNQRNGSGRPVDDCPVLSGIAHAKQRRKK
jgi:DNA-binding transcriptional MerR regulator